MPALLTPPVADDATRRQFLTGLTVAGLLTGCGANPRSGDDAAGVATREICHPLGVTQVPLAPARVLPLDSNELEQVVALGFEPVGTIPDRLPQLPDSAYTPEVVFTEAYEVKLETVTLVRPDVIIGPDFYVEPLYPQLSAIAPTVVIDRPTLRSGNPTFATWPTSSAVPNAPRSCSPTTTSTSHGSGPPSARTGSPR